MPSDTTPLLPQSSREQPPQGDSHPITLRACHSPWRIINQKFLFTIRTILTSYLTSVAGVALKYKLDNDDSHSGWRIPFQFSTVAFVLQWIYHLTTLAWTGMHTFNPNVEEEEEDSRGSRIRTGIARFFSPSHQVTNAERLGFSMFYTVSHVFALLNTLLYWAVLVPSGHGGFKPPEFPHHRHSPGNSTGVFYDPNKGLFEEDDIKAFSILNIWSITALIAFFEITCLNSIRRQSPVVGHVAGIVLASGLYLGWAGIGKLATDHWGLFFLDPKLVGDSQWAAVAGGIGFVALAPAGESYPLGASVRVESANVPRVFTYVYGLIAMRESVTAAH
ncbi:hypothetical protein GGR50DRAFT_386130 [Xylaria sp. CBS 124048]|nr:hypothetical protein GGR50DRAFT_386130 [Xylaria sp. CBS 124048]